MDSITDKIRDLMENEARSGSMDFGCITPFYRMFGGQYSMADIEGGLAELRKQGAFGL